MKKILKEPLFQFLLIGAGLFLLFSLVNKEEAKNEIGGSKKELEERLGITVKSFCYPNGTASDYDDETIRLVKSAGFDSATTAFQDEKIHEGLFAIRRMAPTHNLKEFRFLTKVFS